VSGIELEVKMDLETSVKTTTWYGVSFQGSMKNFGLIATNRQTFDNSRLNHLNKLKMERVALQSIRIKENKPQLLKSMVFSIQPVLQKIQNNEIQNDHKVDENQNNNKADENQNDDKPYKNVDHSNKSNRITVTVIAISSIAGIAVILGFLIKAVKHRGYVQLA
jgi:hypothetical protein